MVSRSRSHDVQLLETTTVSQIRSTIHITSLSDVLSELIQNALDASASRIECSINLERWGVTVGDNGVGMDKKAVEVVGGRYATSKATDLSSLEGITTYGFRGEALASIAALSLLEINSKHKSEKYSYAKVIKGGTLISYGPSRKYERSSTGTTVTVKDLFYNIPVRRSQILLSTPFTSDMSDNEKAASAAELSACRKVIETIALAFPEVSFTLNLETQGGPSEPSGRQMKRILTVQKTDSSVKTFQALFGKTLIKGVKEIHLWADDVRIDGFVSFVGHTTKAHQYLYVNNFPLKNRELQRTIEKRFQRTNFGRDDDASGGRMAGRGSPRNVMYLKPVYVLKVQLETRRLDLGMGPRKREIGFEDHEHIGRILATVIDDALAAEGFKQEPRRVSSPKTTPPRHTSRFDTRPTTLSQSMTIQDQRSESMGHNRAEEECGTSTGIPFESTREPPLFELTSGRLSLQPGRAGDKIRNAPEWLQSAWKDPTNQVFLDKTQCVPSLVSPPIRKTYYPDGPHDQGQSSLGKRKERLQDPSIDLETVSLTRDQLAKASVIGQLDRKFIVCIVPASTESECLIVFDQHAVDERIRVERFLHELCQGFANGDIELHDLGEDPHHLLLSSGEAESLYNHAQYITIFQRWGIHIALEDAELAHPDPETGLHQIQVTAVPAILSKRLAGNSAKEVKQIVTTYLEFLEQQGLKAVTALAQRLKKGGTDLDETALMRWMPASILDLVNSRACRGAIMFNDELTLLQCQRLIQRLWNCSHPFICAHGRPSVTPMVAFDAGKMFVGRDGQQVDWSRVDLADIDT